MCKIINLEDIKKPQPSTEKPKIFRRLCPEDIKRDIENTKILNAKISHFIKKLVNDDGFDDTLVYGQMVKTTEEVSFEYSTTDNHDKFQQAAHDAIINTGTRLGGSGKLCKQRLAELKKEYRKENDGELLSPSKETRYQLSCLIDKLRKEDGYEAVLVYTEMFKIIDSSLAFHSGKYARFQQSTYSQLKQFYPELCWDCPETEDAT